MIPLFKNHIMKKKHLNFIMTFKNFFCLSVPRGSHFFPFLVLLNLSQIYELFTFIIQITDKKLRLGEQFSLYMIPSIPAVVSVLLTPSVNSDKVVFLDIPAVFAVVSYTFSLKPFSDFTSGVLCFVNFPYFLVTVSHISFARSTLYFFLEA